MHTEDEARTKWCPMARVAYPDVRPVVVNRLHDVPSPDPCRCIASQCMAWQWDMQFESQTEEGHGGDVLLRLKRRQGEPKRGFCGLAGR